MATQLTIQQAFDLALQHHQAGRLNEAEALYRQILANCPEHAEAMHFLGVIANQVGHHDVAADLIRRAISLRPDYAEAYSNLGVALRNQGQFDEAINAYRQAIALRPDFPETHSNMGAALRDAGRLDEAIAACRRAIALKPKYAEAHSILGSALKENGQLDEAIAACRAAIELRPNHAETHNNLGAVLMEKGQLDEAIAAYCQAVALDPHYAEAHSRLGAAVREKGRLDEAIAAYRRANPRPHAEGLVDLRTGTDEIAGKEGAVARPSLAICVALKNRSRRTTSDGCVLELFPRCVRSLAGGLLPEESIELSIADFSSSDWPLEQWISDAAVGMSVKILRIEGDFSRGKARNEAARATAADALFFCDADMLIPAGLLSTGLKLARRGVAFFPVCRWTAPDGTPTEVCATGYGNAFIRRSLFEQTGGWPEFKSWGGEDNLFWDRCCRVGEVCRILVPGLLHQWHPPEFCDEFAATERLSEYHDAIRCRPAVPARAGTLDAISGTVDPSRLDRQTPGG